MIYMPRTIPDTAGSFSGFVSAWFLRRPSSSEASFPPETSERDHQFHPAQRKNQFVPSAAFLLINFDYTWTQPVFVNFFSDILTLPLRDTTPFSIGPLTMSDSFMTV